MGKLRLEEQITPAIPPTGTSEIFIDSGDKRAKQIDDSGTIFDLTSLVGGDADQVVISAVKSSPGTIPPGQVVYIVGWSDGDSKIEVELADASVAATMPAIGITRGTITDVSAGDIVAFGDIGSINTNGLAVGDPIYVSETAGAFTTTKPQGAALIQKLATVTRVDLTDGRLFVAGALRSNDLPNLPTQNVWVGDSNSVPVAVSRNGIDLTAFHEDQAGEIQALTEKASPVSADVVVIEDTQDSNNKKKVQIGNLPGGGGGGTDENVKVSANDTTAGYLSEKVVVAEQVNPTNVLELNELNDGANEDLEISFDETKLSITESQISDLGPYNNYSHPNHTGDVTSIGDGAQTIAPNAVTNAKAADMPANTIKGNDTGAPADPKDLTPAEARALLNVEDGANNYAHPNHTGEVTSTGDGAQVLDPTAISNKTNVVAAATDEILIGDASDAGNLKKVTAQSIADLGGGGTDELVKVSSNDAQSDYLGNKVIAANQVNPTNALEINEVNDGGNEDLEVSFDETKITITESQISDLGPYNFYVHPNHTGEVTSVGDGAQALANTAISNKTEVDAAEADYVLIGDTSDSDNLKKTQAESIADLAREEHSAASEGVSSTTSLTFQEKLSLAFTALAADYLIEWSAEIYSSEEACRVQTQVQVDDTTTLHEGQTNPDTKNQIGYGQLSGFRRLTLAAGARFVDFDFSSSSGDSVSVRRVRLRAWRVKDE